MKICRMAVVVLSVVLAGQAAERPAAANDLVSDLAGVWTAPAYSVKLSGDLHRTVWGEGASEVRTVELAITPSGDATVKVATSVVGPKGEAKQYSASVTEARLRIEPPLESEAPSDRVRFRVTVLGAEQWYLDDEKDRRAVEGLEIPLSVSRDHPALLQFRFDTPRGRGSFGETLRRAAGRTGR